MAPEGAARGPVRYATVFRMRTPRSVFLSSFFCPAHGASFGARTARRTRPAGGRAVRRASMSRPRFSRARSLPGPTRSSRDPHDANHPTGVAFRPLLHARAWPPRDRERRLLEFRHGRGARSNVRFFLHDSDRSLSRRRGLPPDARPTTAHAPRLRNHQRPLAVRRARAQELHAQDARHPLLLHRRRDRPAVLFPRAAVSAKGARRGFAQQRRLRETVPARDELGRRRVRERVHARGVPRLGRRQRDRREGVRELGLRRRAIAMAGRDALRERVSVPTRLLSRQLTDDVYA